MHFSKIKTIAPICNNDLFSVTEEGILTSFNSKLYLINENTYEQKLIADFDSKIYFSYIKKNNLFVSFSNSILINDLKINFIHKISYFNVHNEYLIISFYNKTFIFKYKMHKITSPYFLCKMDRLTYLDYHVANEKTDEYLELISEYDLETTCSIFTDKFILGDKKGNINFLSIENFKMISEPKSKYYIKFILNFMNNLYILDENRNLYKDTKKIQKNVIGISVVKNKLIICLENGLYDLQSKSMIYESQSKFIKYSDGVALTDEHEILINENLFIGNNDEITDLCINKNLTNFYNENHLNKKSCIKEDKFLANLELGIATNSGRLRFYKNNQYDIFYDQSDSILSLAQNDSLLFTCSRDRSMCIYNNNTLIMKITDITLLSLFSLENDLYAIGENKIYFFNFKKQKIPQNFTLLSFTDLLNSTDKEFFIKLEKFVTVEKEINYLAHNNNSLGICFDKEISVYDRKLNLINNHKCNKKINVIFMNKEFLYSGSKTLQMHKLETLEVIDSLQINIPLVSMNYYKDGILLGDINGCLYFIRNNKVIFKKQFHKDRIWVIKVVNLESDSFIITGGADGIINIIKEDTHEYEERIKEENKIIKQNNLDIKILKEKKDYKNLIIKMITNNSAGLEKELLIYYYNNNKVIPEDIIILLINKLTNNKMNLKYLEIINYLSNTINLPIRSNIIEGMDDLFREFIKLKNELNKN